MWKVFLKKLPFLTLMNLMDKAGQRKQLEEKEKEEVEFTKKKNNHY